MSGSAIFAPGGAPHHSVVYRATGTAAGWPANYGLWAFRTEVVAVFARGYLGAEEDLHARDMTRPFTPLVARSTDGGETWASAPFAGRIPGHGTLSGDEHVIPELRSGPAIDPDRDLPPLDRAIDFTDPETVVMCARTGLAAGAVSWFYVSTDRARTWQGPYRLGSFGQPGIAARTDIVALAPQHALFLLTAAKTDGEEGRVISVETRDGGRSFALRGLVGAEPDGFAIMPASLRLPNGGILCAVRCASAGPWTEKTSWIDLYRSDDLGRSWSMIARPVPDSGYGGNPPAMVRLDDGRIVLVYGARKAPFGIRARVSTDAGRSWGDEIVLRDDAAGPDLGYPRLIAGPDGVLLAVYYYNDDRGAERFIAATRFRLA